MAWQAIAGSRRIGRRINQPARRYFPAPWHFLYFFPLPQGKDRCDQPSRPSAAAPAGSRLPRPPCWPLPAPAASCAGTPSPARRWSWRAGALKFQSPRLRVHRQRPCGTGHRRCGGNRAIDPRSSIHRLAIRARICIRNRNRTVSSWNLEHHRLEHVEGFPLVFHQRITLRISAQPESLPSGGPSTADGPSTIRQLRSASPSARGSAWSPR